MFRERPQKMQAPCTGEASTCFNGCCVNPFLGLPDSHSSIIRSTTTSHYEFAVSTATYLYPNTRFTNHESLPSLPQLFSNFTEIYPQYLETNQADKIRAQEYYHLSLSNHVCLDYNGHGLFSYLQQRSHYSAAPVDSPHPLLHSSSASTIPFFKISNKLGNLYSQLRYGGKESEFDSIIRKRIMRFMNISEDDYSVVFTANQSSAFKLLTDSYPFKSNRNLLTVYDYENEAVETMIDCSKKKGAHAMSAKFSWPKMSIYSTKLRKMVMSKRENRKRGLFVFPLQSKMTGARYPYLWISTAQKHGWHVLLDASALGSKDMETLGLSIFKPEFLFSSFYKVFGDNPSGFGCLFVKKSTTSLLINSDTTSLGIVSLLPDSRPFQFLDKSSSFEIETGQQSSPYVLYNHNSAVTSSSSSPVPSVRQNKGSFQIQDTQEAGEKRKNESVPEIIELENPLKIEHLENNKLANGSEDSGIEFRGLNHADSLGLILISARTRYLINWLVNALTSLQHPHSEHGLPLVRIYGPTVRFDRGPSVSFNVFDWKGEMVEPALVQKLADRNNISLTSGFLKNIWFSNKNDKDRIFMERKTPKEQGNTSRNTKERCDIGISVLTASLGFLTNFEDTYRLWAFISQFLDADFVEKERWRYTALNQRTIEV